MSKKKKIGNYIFLHIVLLLYSFISVVSKWSGSQEFESKKFLFFYMMIISLLFFYAMLWQQVLKRFLLTTAFANKAIVVIWGILWGKMWFGEEIGIQKLIGCGIIMLGIIVVAKEE